MNTDKTGDISQPNSESVNRTQSNEFNEQSLAAILRRDFGNLDTSDSAAEPADNYGSEDPFSDTSDDGYSDSLNQGTEVHSQEEEATGEDSEFQTKGVQKRIDKLTALRKQAEEEAERLKGEVDELRAKVESNQASEIVIKADEAVPYANLNSIAEIEQEVAQARSVRRWCEENSHGVVVTNSDGSETEYTSEDVKRIKLNAIDALEEHLPKRVTYIQTKAKVDSVAHKVYPWLKDKTSKERQIAETFLKAFPQITRFPDYNMVIGDYIAGVKSRESSNRNYTRAPVQPTSNYAPSGRYKDNIDPDATRRYVKSNSQSDLAAIIKSKFI